MTTETAALGLPPEEILERNAGGLESVAYIVQQLAVACEVAQAEFTYDDSDLGQELARRCKELGGFLEGVYLTPEAKLTAVRECGACGGAGSWNKDGSPCDECKGTGADPSSSFQPPMEDS